MRPLKGETTVRAVVGVFVMASVAGCEQATVTKIDRVLVDTLTTERVYVDALSHLVAFVPLLREHLADIGLITSLEALHGMHKVLLAKLESAGEQRARLDAPEAIEAGANKALAIEQHLWGVSEALNSLCPYLRMYSTFCAGYARTLKRVSELRRKPCLLYTSPSPRDS